MKSSLLSAIMLLTAQVAFAQLQLSFSTAPPSCNGFTNGSATVNASGGTEPYAYNWSNFQSGQTTLGVGAGSLSVTVTDANGLSATGNVTVPQPAVAQVSITPSGISCSDVDGTLTATATGGTGAFAFLWDNGTSNATRPINSGGLYFVTATDANGCPAVANFNVQPLLAEVFVTNIPCSTLPFGGAANVAVSGGTPPHSYLWNMGSMFASVQNLPQGTYTVTVTDAAGCSVVQQGTITQPTPIVVDVVSITPACGGNNGSATVSASGGTPPYLHVWDGGVQTGPTATNLSPGQHYVCTFDANNCQNDIWIIIPSSGGLDVSLNIVKAECTGVDDGVVTAIVSPPGNYIYAWSIQGSPSVAQLNGVPANTAVSVTVTDPATGCQGTASGVVGTHTQVQVAVTDTDAACGGAATGSATALASLGTAPYTYTWTFPDNTQVPGPSIANLGPGAYAVVATDARGCSALGVADIQLGSSPQAAYALNVLGCEEEGVSLQFNDQSTDPLGNITGWNWNISWSNGSTSSTQQNPPTLLLPNGETGTVQLTVTSASGCTGTFSAPFTANGLPNVSVQVQIDPNALCENLPVPITVLGEQQYTYSWSPQTGLSFNPDAQNVIANPATTTTYLLTASNGACTTTLPVEIVRAAVPTVDVETDIMQTCDPEALLTASAANSSTITWFNAANQQVGTGASITVPAGSTQQYTVVASNASGCTASDAVTLTGIGVDVDAAINTPISACENSPVALEVVNLDPNDVLSYNWTSSNPNLTITPQGAANVSVSGPQGSYTLTVVVSNQFECERTFNIPVTITEGESLEGQISTDLCAGLTVDFQNNSTVPGTWTFGDGGQSTQNDPTHIYANPGSYTITFVSTQPCVAPFERVIQVLAQPALQAAIGSDLENCVNNATVQFSDATTGTPVSWQWAFSNNQSSNQQNPEISLGQAGNITATLTVTDANGCSSTASSTLAVDIVSEELAQQHSPCPENSTALNPQFNPNYSYNWTATPADPNLQANNPNPSVSPDVSTTYTLNVVNGTCSATFSVQVSPHEAALLSLPEDRVLCSSDPVTVSVANTNATDIKWAQSLSFSPVLATGPTATLNPVPNGMYYVQATTGNGCSTVDSIGLNNAEVRIEADPLDRDLCKGDEAELTITNMMPDQQLNYAWSGGLPGIPNPVVTPNSDATFRVKITNQFGCQDSTLFTLNVIEVTAAASVDRDTICTGQTAQLFGTAGGNAQAYSYVWTPNTALDDNRAQNPIASPQEDTEYTLTVTGDDLCQATATVKVFYMETECGEPYIFVPKAFTPNYDDNNDFFIVRGANIKELYFVVWDRWGEKVYETTDITAKGWDGTYNGKESTPDSYAWYLQVTCGNGAIYTTKGDVTLLK